MKDSNNPNYVPKHRVPVRMVLTDGSQTLGVIFVRQGERVAEVLSRAITFFPILSNNGTSLVNKNHVIKIDVPKVEDVKDREDLFPEVNFKYLENNCW